MTVLYTLIIHTCTQLNSIYITVCIMDLDENPDYGHHERLVDLFSLFQKNKTPLKVCAPMVRYSSLPFRHLVKIYKCDLTYTHMILADCFSKVSPR